MADPIILWILMGSVTTLVSAGNIMDRARLHDSLLHGAYDTSVYPGSTDTPLQVSIHFSLTAFNDFDEKAGRFAVTGFLIAEWMDERMRWDPSDFGLISSTQFPQSRVWTPNIVVWNSYTRIRPFGFDTLPVRYNHSGDVFWEPGNLFETSCDAQIQKFPFDVQTCRIDILPYGYLDNELNFTAAGIDISDYDKNGLWDIVSTDIFEVQTYTRAREKVMVEIRFRRRSSYHVIHTLVPLIIMSILNILVFIIPVDGSTRVDYAVTMLLTLSVFLTVVSDTLPVSSLPEISYLSVLLLIQIMSSSLMLACAVISCRLGSHCEVSLRRLTFILKPFLGRKPEVPCTGTELESPDGVNGNAYNGNEQLLKTQFKHVTKVFDCICISLFLLEVVIVNMIFFIITHI